MDKQLLHTFPNVSEGLKLRRLLIYILQAVIISIIVFLASMSIFCIKAQFEQVSPFEKKKSKLKEAYLNLLPKLEILQLSEIQLKNLDTILKEVDSFQCTDGLENDVVEFIESAVGLQFKHSEDIRVHMKLIKLSSTIFGKVEENSQIASALYTIVLIGMTLYNKQRSEEAIDSLVKRLLEIQLDTELNWECEGIKSELLKGAKFVNTMTSQTLSNHAIPVPTSAIDIRKTTASLNKLESLIIQLRDEQLKNYCNKLGTNFTQLMGLTDVYCCLATMRYGILSHCYLLLQLSGKAPDIAKSTKFLIDNQEQSDINLLEFLVFPLKRTAILHFLEDINCQMSPIMFLELRGIKENDLSFLSKGDFRLSSVKYDHSAMFMSTFFKCVRWECTPKDDKSRFSFKKENVRGNFFRICSEYFPRYYVWKSAVGYLAEGILESPEEDKTRTWKIVLVKIEDKKPTAESMYAILAQKDKPDSFLSAQATGIVCVASFNVNEIERVVWKITKFD